MSVSVRSARWMIGALLFAAVACSETVSPNASFVIHGSASAPPSGPSSTLLTRMSLMVGLPEQDAGPYTIVGDPARVNIGMYALYLSENADCSAPVLVTNNGTTPVVKDFAADPVLFSGSPPAGTYRCVILRISDAIGFRSASASAHCATGVDYNMDIYRAPDTDWKDVNLGTIIATGTDASPSDDKVYLFASTDPSAVIARGVSANQTLTLTGSLTAPGSGTFYWNAVGTITDAGSECGMQPPQLAFR